MKTVIQRLLIGVSLIGGYGLMALLYFGGVLLLGYLAVHLAFNTIEEPSVGIIIVDLAFIGTILFLVSRRKFREGIREFWDQVSKNM